MSLLRFWEILASCNQQRVLISLVSDDLREFAYDGVVVVETEGSSGCASLSAQGDLFIWIDDYSEQEVILNISHRETSELTGVARLLCAMPIRYQELLLRVVNQDGSIVQKWPSVCA